jgi:hypothetical protein
MLFGPVNIINPSYSKIKTYVNIGRTADALKVNVHHANT